jgi:hypothetical protein
MAHFTLFSADDQPTELVGRGPIPADLAGEIAAQGVWRRLLTQPLSGTPLDYGRTTTHPPAGLADHVRVHDQYCRVPRCRRTAADAEVDHHASSRPVSSTASASRRSVDRRTPASPGTRVIRRLCVAGLGRIVVDAGQGARRT